MDINGVSGTPIFLIDQGWPSSMAGITGRRWKKNAKCNELGRIRPTSVPQTNLTFSNGDVLLLFSIATPIFKACGWLFLMSKSFTFYVLFMSDKLKVTWSGFTAVDRWTPQRRSMSSTWSEISLEPPCSKKSGVCRFFQRKSGKPRPGGQVVKAKGCLQLDGFRGRSQRQGSGWKLERPHIATSLGRLSDNGCKFQAAIQWLGARVIHIPIYSLLNWELTKENSPAKWQAGDGWLVTELFFNLARLENCQFFFFGGGMAKLSHYLQDLSRFVEAAAPGLKDATCFWIGPWP